MHGECFALLDVADGVAERCRPDVGVALEVGSEFVKRFGGDREPVATDTVEAEHTPIVANEGCFGLRQECGEIFSRSGAQIADGQHV